MEERISKLEAEAASTTARLAAMEIKMNDRFRHLEDQLPELRRSKVGVELREDINRRFDELREDLNRRFDGVGQRFDGVGQRFEAVDQRFDRVDQRFDDARERHEQTNKRLDRIEIEMREMVRETRSFTRWVVSGQIGIALAILVMAAKPYYG
jgi:chromosome condensin MukBEF ATPase and DNA-binding subunit MukB